MTKIPLRKKTTFLTNILHVYDTFHCKFCDGSCNGPNTQHGIIQGSEGGIKRSTHAQEYPPELVKAVVKSIKKSLVSKFGSSAKAKVATHGARLPMPFALGGFSLIGGF